MTTMGLERVANGLLELTFFPAAGGRLLSVRMNGHEFLWQHPDYVTPDLTLLRPRSSWRRPDATMGSWVNVGGSKTWPAPQGWGGPHEWPGPPDPVLDSGHWDYRVETESGRTVIELTSPFDTRTGLVVTRRFEMEADEPGFRQFATFRNHSPRTVSWAVWEVCQVPAAMAGSDRVEVGVAGEAGLVELLRVRGDAPSGVVRDGVLTVPVVPAVGKVGITDATGVVRYVSTDGSVISLAFDPVSGAPYPDGGCMAELWIQTALTDPLPELGGLHPRHDLVELEVLSPLTTLRPGESVRLTLDWRFVAGPDTDSHSSRTGTVTDRPPSLGDVPAHEVTSYPTHHHSRTKENNVSPR